MVITDRDLSSSGYGYGRGYASSNDEANAATFRIASESRAALNSLIPNSKITNTLLTEGFWKIIITSVAEQHSEAYSLVNTLSDSFVIFATGANPISLSLTGFVLHGKNKDYYTDFTYLYNTIFRGTELRKNKLILEFLVKDTFMNLYVTGMSPNFNSTMQDFIPVTIQGIAYNYENLRGLTGYKTAGDNTARLNPGVVA